METHKLFKVNQNAVIKNNAGEILILKKDGKWMLPGGRMEDHETWREGLEREIREETGIKEIFIEKVLEIDISDSGETYIATFLCKVSDDPEIKLSDEHQEYAWLKIQEIDSYEFWHKKIQERLRTLLL